jgi:hypothetical protein
VNLRRDHYHYFLNIFFLCILNVSCEVWLDKVLALLSVEEKSFVWFSQPYHFFKYTMLNFLFNNIKTKKKQLQTTDILVLVSMKTEANFDMSCELLN